MKNLIWIFLKIIFLIKFSCNSFSQNNLNDTIGNALTIDNKWGTTWPKKIKENKRIKVWKIDESTSSGRFNIVSNNLIEIDGDTIPILGITQIRARTNSIKTIGFVGACVGGLLTFIGIDYLLGDPNDPWSFHDFGYIFLPPGTLLLASGGHVLLNGRKYSTDKGWEISVSTK